MAENENFPRGRITSSKQATPFPNRITPFPSQKNDKKRKRSTSPDNGNSFSRTSELFSTAADGLNYKKIQEQMLVLGCIRDISPLSLEVELPGKTSGKIQINAISQTFLNILKGEYKRDEQEEIKDMARLNTMFKVGQFVPTKVIEKIENSEKVSIILSMDPIHINSDWNHRIIKKGLLLWAAVASKLDHGYLLDAGIVNTRIFLSFENVGEETNLVIGQPLWCVVQESEVTSSVTTITTSILKNHLQTATQSAMSLHYLVPGMQFNFTVSKIVKYGLQGEFINQCVGYINESYLTTPFDQASRYRKQQTVKAWLLYVEPTTKFSHFTLKNINSSPNPEYAKGKILKAQIISKAGGGLNIKLPNKSKAFVSNKRLLNMLPKNNNFNENVLKRFRPDSYHQCRILDYNCMEDVYICTFEPAILKEKYFTESDVKIGELISVKIIKIANEGLQVSFGKLKGFIQNIHLSNSKYSENTKKRLPIGKTLQARVLNVDEKGIYFTLKQELVNSDLCLSSYTDAVVNQQYPGVVVNKSERGVLVVFYGEVRGMLFKKYLLKMYPDYTDNMYYEGQVILTTVGKVMDDFLHLTLNSPKQPNSKPIRVGEYVKAVISAIAKEGLIVEVESHKIHAFVPTPHLSSSLKLTPLLLGTYKIGQTLKSLLCISSKGTPVLSIREARAYKNQDILEFKDLKIGAIIRCSYESSDKSGIYLSAPFASKSIKIRIPNEQLMDNSSNLKSLELQPHQAIVVKVLGFDEHRKIIATARLHRVFNNDYKYSLDLLKQYLRDIEQVRKHLINIGSPLAEFKLGQRVECEVCTVGENGCKVLLENGVEGFVSNNHYSKNIRPGQKLQGLVLFANYPEQYLEISLNKNVIKKVNEIQDGNIDKDIGSASHADFLIGHPEYVIALLRNKDTNQQLIFLPPKFHENAYLVQIRIEQLSKIKVVIDSKVNHMLVGMDKGVIHALNKSQTLKRKNENKVSTSKRARIDKKIKEIKEEYEDVEILECKKEENGEEFENKTIKSEEENGYEDEDDASIDEEDDDSAGLEVKVEEDDDESQDLDEEDSESEASDDSMEVEEEEEEENKEDTEESQTNTEDNDNSEEEVEGEKEVDEEESTDEELELKKINNKQKDSKKIIQDKPNVSFENKNGASPKKSILPGVQNFFTEPKVLTNEESSSSEEEDVSEIKTKDKKKKLTPAQRKELARLEEEKLIKKEIENANLAAEPQTEEQFRKLVKGKPNCSETWIKFISHFISNAEFDKARAVAQEALQTIDMQLIEERFNIWISCLNFENDYGDKNSFEEIFNEAVKCNDSLKIYLAVIKILADSQKNKEMEEKIQKAKNKFGRESLKLWLEIGRIYYQKGQLKEARNAKDAGISKLTVKINQIMLVVQFAIMEFQYGEKNQGEALFETLLQHNPKRVDIWTTYIDQVIKKNDFDTARRILDRAVSQSIPKKKQITLLKKYKNFELQHGTEEQVQHVIELARKCAGGIV